MNWILIICGGILVLLASYDIIRTTINNNGAGLLSSRIASAVWIVLFKLAGKKGKRKLLAQSGLCIILCLVLSWILAIWFGYTLIFISDPQSVQTSSSNTSTSFLEKVYYVGYTLSTMGNGDLVASTPGWKIFSVIVSFSGLTFLTLAITYLIPILSAVVAKRKLSAYIFFLGSTPVEMLNNGWDGKTFKNLEQHFQGLADLIIHHKERHLLYPVLHYFHSTDDKYAAPKTLTVLDEAITMLLYHPDLKNKFNKLSVKILRNAMDEYLLTLSSTYIGKSRKWPEIPHVDDLQMTTPHGNEILKECYEKLKERRQLLMGLVHKDGWKWTDIYSPRSTTLTLDLPNVLQGN
ncbi:potassium channel family protein [Fulvivirga sediminis]|uniref:Two pore domain potassium channel family protein n=1 Tax=Fulvivirga sediminis TaxID=2803949 RepID=A0A937K0G7_9BACT|nr:potassium channel family protein [Fulvivirga sediminis]MBL3656290.1 two pore domain potassium channel family protein [Fulvivirga sediminis]